MIHNWSYLIIISIVRYAFSDGERAARPLIYGSLGLVPGGWGRWSIVQGAPSGTMEWRSDIRPSSWYFLIEGLLLELRERDRSTHTWSKRWIAEVLEKVSLVLYLIDTVRHKSYVVESNVFVIGMKDLSPSPQMKRKILQQISTLYFGWCNGLMRRTGFETLRGRTLDLGRDEVQGKDEIIWHSLTHCPYFVVYGSRLGQNRSHKARSPPQDWAWCGMPSSEAGWFCTPS